MRILLLVDDYLPESQKIAPNMIRDLSSELALQGHSPFVLAPKHELGFTFATKRTELENVQCVRFGSGNVKHSSKIVRLISEFIMPFMAFIALSRRERKSFDAVVCYSPSIFWGIFLFLIKLNNRTLKVFTVLRDFFPQWVIDEGIISKNSPLAFFFRRVERILYRYSDYIGIQSKKNIQIFSNANQSEKAKVVELNNWVGENSYTNAVNIGKPAGKTGITFFYGGTLGYAQGALDFLKLCEGIAAIPSCRVMLVGSGDAYEHLQKEVESKNLERIKVLPPVDQTKYQKLLSEADVGMFSLSRKHTTHNYPGKLMGYMIQEKPIVGIANPENEIKQIIEGNKAGLVYDFEEEMSDFLARVSKFVSSENFTASGINSNQVYRQLFSPRSAANTIISCLSKGGLDDEEKV